VANKPARKQGARGGQGTKELEERDSLLRELRMHTPRLRSRALKRLISELNATREEFADLIEVHWTTVYKYLNESGGEMPAHTVLLRIKKLKQEVETGHAPDTLLRRFLAAAEDIFGKETLMHGFSGPSAVRAEVVRWLGSVTCINERTLYRRLPPYDKPFRPTLRMLSEFEKAASEMPSHIRRLRKIAARS
jgi:predicted transcriptional regulator